MGVDQPLTYPVIDNLVEGKRKRRSNISSPATPTASSSSSSTTPTRKITDSPRASSGVLSGKRKLITSEEERSPAKRGRKSATVKPGEYSLLPHPPSDHCGMQGQLLERRSLISGNGRSVLLQSWDPAQAQVVLSLLHPPLHISQQSPVEIDKTLGLDWKHSLSSV